MESKSVWKGLLFGGIGGCWAETLVFPLDVVKTRLQMQGADGKKLWELLITDGANSFRHVESVPSNCVNSRELRSRVQRLIDEAEVQPTTIRFFRTQMKNMISIALSELPDVTCKPSRVTYALYDWLDEREASRRCEPRACCGLLRHAAPCADGPCHPLCR